MISYCKANCTTHIAREILTYKTLLYPVSGEEEVIEFPRASFSFAGQALVDHQIQSFKA